MIYVLLYLIGLAFTGFLCSWICELANSRDSQDSETVRVFAAFWPVALPIVIVLLIWHAVDSDDSP